MGPGGAWWGLEAPGGGWWGLKGPGGAWRRLEGPGGAWRGLEGPGGAWRGLDPTDCSPPGSSVPGISQASTLEWDAIAFSHIIQQCINKLGKQVLYAGGGHQKAYQFAHNEVGEEINKKERQRI